MSVCVYIYICIYMCVCPYMSMHENKIKVIDNPGDLKKMQVWFFLQLIYIYIYIYATAAKRVGKYQKSIMVKLHYSGKS